MERLQYKNNEEEPRKGAGWEVVESWMHRKAQKHPIVGYIFNLLTRKSPR